MGAVFCNGKPPIGLIALHEAGHAVAALALGYPLHGVTIADGRFHAEVDPPGNALGAADTRREADDLMTLLWAGAAAEMCGEVAYLAGWTGDVGDAIALIQLSPTGVFRKAEKQLVAKHCLYTDKIKDKLKRKLYDQFGGGARELVGEHLAVIREVAAMLVEQGELTGEQVRAVFERGCSNTVYEEPKPHQFAS